MCARYCCVKLGNLQESGRTSYCRNGATSVGLGEDRLKTVGCVTVLFDNELNRWAIVTCGAGMDLTPQLVAYFINLDKCVPLYLAQSMCTNYPGYMDKKVHYNNCYIVGKDLQNYGK